MIEGVMIAAHRRRIANGIHLHSRRVSLSVVIMQKAIADAYAKGFLGKNIFGSGNNFDMLLAHRRWRLRSGRRVGVDGVARGQAWDSAYSPAVPCCRRALGRADRHQ